MKYRKIAISALAIIAGLAGSTGRLAAQSPYFPLRQGAAWTLQSPTNGSRVEMSVLGEQGGAFHIRFASPFGVNEWMLQPRGDRYYLIAYGANGQLAPLPGDTVYFDFGAKARTRWSNKIGRIEVASRNDAVSAPAGSYRDCISISQAGGMTFTFASGVGPVRFTAGKVAFLLTSAGGGAPSVTSGATPPGPGANDGLPAQHVPTPGYNPGQQTSAAPVPMVKPSGVVGKPLFSITPNVFANEADTPQNLLRNFDLVTATGLGFLVHNGKWNELEPKPGQYDFSALDFNVATAKKLNIPICYTLRIIETVERAVPSELKKVSWSDPKLQNRLDALVDAMVPHFQGTVRWFLIGNEIDGYFGRHQNELSPYATLYRELSQRLKQKVPGLRVSATLMFGGVGLMDGFMKPLADQFDFICFTYYPIRGDFTMEDPQSVYGHVDRMRAAARGRKVVLQEIGYASGQANGSSPDKQAEFVRDVFDAMGRNGDVMEAGCFWLLADLKPAVVQSLAGYYGMGNSAVFRSFLQTLGMFDGNGKPKPAWDAFKSGMGH